MGYDVYFTCAAESAQTPVLNFSYSFNTFYRYFDLPHYCNKPAAEMLESLKRGIAELERVCHTLTPSKNELNATPGNYHAFLKVLLSYATMHPSWTFHCD